MTNEKTDLLPCPFCGGEAKISKITLSFFKMDSFWGCCRGCGVMTASFKTEAKAITAWNTRIDEEAQILKAHEAVGHGDYAGEFVKNVREHTHSNTRPSTLRLRLDKACDIIARLEGEKDFIKTMPQQGIADLLKDYKQLQTQWCDLVVQRVQLQNRLAAAEKEIERLVVQAEGYGDLLGSANHDVEELTKWGNDLKKENEQLCILLRKTCEMLPVRMWPKGVKAVVARKRAARLRLRR